MSRLQEDDSRSSWPGCCREGASIAHTAPPAPSRRTLLPTPSRMRIMCGNPTAPGWPCGSEGHVDCVLRLSVCLCVYPCVSLIARPLGNHANLSVNHSGPDRPCQSKGAGLRLRCDRGGGGGLSHDSALPPWRFLRHRWLLRGLISPTSGIFGQIHGRLRARGFPGPLLSLGTHPSLQGIPCPCRVIASSSSLPPWALPSLPLAGCEHHQPFPWPAPGQLSGLARCWSFRGGGHRGGGGVVHCFPSPVRAL